MTDDIFNVKRRLTKRVIVLLGSGTKNGTSINYFTEGKYEIYVMCNYSVYAKYLESLLQPNELETHLVPVFSSMEELYPLLYMINKIGGAPAGKTKLKFIDNLKYFMKVSSLDDNEDYDGDDIPINLSPGQAERPLNMDLIIVLDSDLFSQDHLLPYSVSTQQLLRFLSLQHSGSFAIVSGVQSFISSGASILSLVKFIDQSVEGQPNESQSYNHPPEPISIYDEDGVFISDNLFVNILIPLGWDSWSKIEILAKSAAHGGPQLSKSRLLSSLEEIQEFNTLYEQFLDADPIDEQAQTKLIQYMSKEEENQDSDRDLPKESSFTKTLNFHGLLKEALAETYYMS